MNNTENKASSRDTDFYILMTQEVGKARAKFPSPNKNFAALIEEVGEVAQALIDDRFDGVNVREECVQVAAMALRLAIEGDPTMLYDGKEKRQVVG